MTARNLHVWWIKKSTQLVHVYCAQVLKPWWRHQDMYVYLVDHVDCVA